MKRKMLSVFMALMLCLTMLPATAFAASTGAEVHPGGDKMLFTDRLPGEKPVHEQQLETFKEKPTEHMTEWDNQQDTKQSDTDVLSVPATVDLMPTAEDGEHIDHCLCGSAICSEVGDHKCESVTEFIAWTDEEAAKQYSNTEYTAANSLPKESGSYYLTKDVRIDSEWCPSDGTVLCLNGYDITCNGENSVITVVQDKIFTLTDCKTGDLQGKITHGKDESGQTYVGCGIGNQGNFVMYGGVITGNKSDGSEGGGVDNNRNAIFNMYGGNIENNTAEVSGGGVCNYGTFYLHGGSIKNNTAEYGGGVECYTCVNEDKIVFEMSGGSIEYNTADEYGGGVYLDTVPGSTIEFVMTAGSIKNNSAVYGGGVCVDRSNCTYTLSGGSVENNTAGDDGGGVYVRLGNFAMTGGTVTNNTAVGDGGGVFINDNAESITLGGTAKITENKSSTKINNLYLSKKKVISLDSENPLSEGAFIGLSADFKWQIVVNNIGESEKYFSVDDAETYQLTKNGDDLVMEVFPVIVVGGKALTESSDDVLNDGGSVKYDKDEQILTLTNANISGGYEFGNKQWAAIYSKNMELTIKLVGKNTVTAPEKKDALQSYGICVEDLLNISGSGSLSALSQDAELYSYAVYAEDLTVEDGVTLTAVSGEAKTTQEYYYVIAAGIYVYGDMSIGKANVTATGDAATGTWHGDSIGIYCNGDMEIGDGAVVKATGDIATGTGKISYTGGAYSDGICIYGDLTIGKAKVTAVGGMSNGLYYA